MSSAAFTKTMREPLQAGRRAQRRHREQRSRIACSAAQRRAPKGARARPLRPGARRHCWPSCCSTPTARSPTTWSPRRSGARTPATRSSGCRWRSPACASRCARWARTCSRRWPAAICSMVAPGALDAEVFEQRVRQGRAALDARRAGPRQPSCCAPPTRSGAVRRSSTSATAAFAPDEIRRLDELRLAPWKRASTPISRSAATPSSSASSSRWSSAHPTRDHFAAQLMLALYRCGRQVEALNVYQRARALICMPSSGLEPGPELQALQARILNQDPGAAARAPRRRCRPSCEAALAVPLADRRSEYGWLRRHWDRGGGRTRRRAHRRARDRQDAPGRRARRDGLRRGRERRSTERPARPRARPR